MKLSVTENPAAKPQQLLKLARDHLGAKRFADVIDALDRAESKSNGKVTPAALQMRMLALINLDRAAEAAEFMPQLLAVERSDEEWLRVVGRMAVRLEQWQTVADAWSQYRRINPDDGECLRNLLNAYCLTGQHEMALEVAETLAAMGLEDAEVMHVAARANIELGNIYRAVELVRSLFMRDEQRTAEWLSGLQGPWWVLVRTMALLDGSQDPVAAALRLRLQAGAFATALFAEIRHDWIAAYAAYRAASLAGDDNVDAQGGLTRMRNRLASMLAGDSDATISVADAMAIVFTDESLFGHWEAVLARMATEADWQVAGSRLSAVLPPHLRPQFAAELKRASKDKRKKSHPHARHYRELLREFAAPRASR